MANKIERRSHQPKGGMCANCTKRSADCSDLKFEEMPVILTASDGIKIVRCTEWKSRSASLV